MAFLAPLIAPAIGLGELGLVGEAIVGVGLSFGVSYLAKELQPKSSTAAPSGMHLSLSYDPNEARRIPFGICASAGALAYHNVYGPNGNDYVQMVYRLGDVACDSLVKVYGNGKQLTLGAHVNNGTVSGYTINEYPGAMWIEFHNGDWNQDADNDLVAHATGGAFLSTYRGRGICYVRVTMKFDATLYKNGLPAFIWVFKGAKLYDWRKDSTAGGSGSHRWGDESTYEWTENSSVILYNWYRGVTVNGNRVGGMNVPAMALPFDVWTAAANACDEIVGKKDGTTEARYAMGGTVFVDSDNATVCRDMVTSMAGSVADCGGVLKLYSGVSQASVLSITDDDIMWDQEVTYLPKKSRSGLVNAVFGSFNDPKQLYQSAALPPRISPDDEAADGGFQLTENYGLTYVSSGTRGQRITEILRRQGRFQRNLTLTLSAIALAAESCDWITWTSRRYGFESMLFKVVQGTVNPDGTVAVELVEVANSIFAWNPVSDELDPANPNEVGPGGVKFSTVQGLALETAVIVADDASGIQRPGLRATWTPVDDATVTGLALEYRKVGTTTALKDTILDPTTGQYTWVAGIQSGVEYEARLNLITAPPRPTVFTSWVATETSTAPQVVAVATTANSVPPGTITPEMLDQQSRLELQLVTGLADLQGSVNERIENAINIARQAAAAAMGAIAQQSMLVQAVRAQADGNSIGVTETLKAIAGLNDGLQAQWTVSIDVNGNIKGLVQLFSDAEASLFSVLADRIVFCLPDGTGAKQIITVGLLADGSTGVGIDANNVILKGTIKAEHMDATSLATLRIADPDDTYFYNFAIGKQGSTDGRFTIDMSDGPNRGIDISF